MLILVCLLYVAPVGWVLAGLNSAIFLWNGDFCRGSLRPACTRETQVRSS